MRARPPSGAGRRATLACTLLALLSGCASVGPPTTARTLDRGRFQVDFRQVGCALDLDGVTDPEKGPDRKRYTWSLLEIGVQYGVTDRLELGARIGTGAQAYTVGALRAKVALHRAASAEEGLDLSLAPGLTVTALSGGGPGGGFPHGRLVYVELPLLLGVNLRSGSQLVLGLGLADLDQEGSTSFTTNTLGVGGQVAFSWKAAPGVRLMPGIVVGHAPSTWVRGWERTSPGAERPHWRSTFYQATCSLLMGGD